MELKAGMYVRTKHNGIKKIVALYTEAIFTDSNTRIENKNIIKASYNIIDLIEPGDYVNGFLVREVQKVPNEEIGKVVVTDSSNCDCWEGAPIDYRSEEIKSIVTKEQFENMSYKVGE